MNVPLKIGIVGPESTGKSQLGQELAQQLHGLYVPEYAREYVGRLERPYTYEDVCLIAEQNRRESNQQEGTGSFIFFDTELIITKVWLDEVYHRRPAWLTDPVPADCRMDFYLLLSPDIAAEPDPLRENLDQASRERLFERYLSEIRATGRRYGVVTGQNKERTANAIRLLREHYPTLIEQQ